MQRTSQSCCPQTTPQRWPTSIGIEGEGRSYCTTSKGFITVVSETVFYPKSITYQRIHECHGRPTTEGLTLSQHRVESPPFSDTETVDKLVYTNDRPIRNTIQQEASSLCEPLPRSRRHSSGRSLPHLGSYESVCVSTIRNSEQSDPEVRTDCR